MANALVRRVRFFGKRVQAIEVERFGRVLDLKCDRVVLAAGAIATPGVLLRSGIGPDADLVRLGINRVHHAPGVGARLLDHPGLAIFFLPYKKGFASVDHPLVQTVCRYTSTDPKTQEPSVCTDDMQLQPGSWVPLPRLPVPAVTIATCIGKPRGHGRLRVVSTHANDAPRIETAFLSHEDDRARAREALRWIGRLSKTKAVSALARPVYPSRNPFNADGEFSGAMEQITGSGYHPCGTAPMGPDDDPLAVTDGRGRVRGVQGLFIADASLMPTIPTSNTNVPTLMIGEKIGEWLKET